METFNSDPKPGRIVLPLVLIGMIATTYTFINRVATNNNLEIVTEDTTVTTSADVVTEETTTSTTTTTLPEDYVAYLEEITAEKIQANELGKKVLEANQNWDDKTVTYQEAKQDFAAFIDDAEEFVVTVTDPGPPNQYANLVTSHEELKTLVNLIALDTVELLAGLESSDTGEQRAAALNSFNKNLDQFIKKVEEIVASATSS
jgi:PHD/YefM family antitoxin component YafN of YafNO toxin-antitoxin module